MIGKKLESLEISAPPTLVDHVVAIVREGIMDGSYPLGSKLDQTALAEELGVSVVPVRESLRRLEAEGLVHFYPRRGASVIELSAEELQEVYLIRGLLEELAAQLAAPHLSAQILDRLADLIKESEDAVARDDYDLLLDVNRMFHFTIYEASESPILLEVITGLYGRSSPYRRLYSHLPDRAPEALAAHKRIYSACKDADPATLGQFVRGDIQAAARHIIDRFTSEAQHNTVTFKRSRGIR